MWRCEMTRPARIIIAAAVAVLVVVGCSDNPEHKAAKQLRRSTRQALDIARAEGDFDKAGKTMKTALKAAPEAGSAAEPAVLTSANLGFERAQRLQSNLVTLAEPVNIALDEISAQVHEISRLQIQAHRLNSLIAATNSQIEELSKLVRGNDRDPGLQEQLSVVDAAMAELEQQKAEFEQQWRQAQKTVESIQQQADEKLRQAEGAGGDEKLKLQRAGYDLLLSKKSHFLEAQDALDRMKSIESRIAIVQPQAEALAANLAAVQQQIEKIRSSQQSEQLQTQLKEVNRQIEERNGRIAWLGTDLDKAQKSYRQAVEEIISLFGQVAKDYKKVRSRSLGKAAAAGLADCYAKTALAALDSMKFQQHVSLRLQSIAGAIEGRAADTLSETGSRYAKVASEYGQKALENFDLAIEEYSKLQKRFGTRSDEFACDVIKNYILALYGKMVLSEYLGQADAIDELLGQADELMEKAQACDGRFSRSAIVSLLSGSAEYVPSLPVDNTAYYTEMKKDFQLWKTLRGEEKEAEVKRLLAILDELGPPQDPELFERIIGPERGQLEAALARGFEEEEVAMVTDYGAGDPNFYY